MNGLWQYYSALITKGKKFKKLLQTQTAFITKMGRFYYNVRQVLQCGTKIEKTRAKGAESLRRNMLNILSFKQFANLKRRNEIQK